MLRVGLLPGLVFAGRGLWRDCTPAETSMPPFCRPEGYVAKLQLPEKRHSDTPMSFETPCVIPDGEWVVSTSRGSQRIRVVDGGVDCAP